MDTPDEEAINSGVAALGLTNPSSDRSMTDLLQRSRTLIAELDEFRTYLKNQKKDKGVELRHFGSCLQSEFKSLEKLANLDPGNEKVAHTISSSNFPFYFAVWSTAKSCTAITAMRKRFFWSFSDIKSKRFDLPMQKGVKSVEVDIVANDGLEWVKVNTITARRMLYDLTKAGWHEDDSSDDEQDALQDDDDEPEGLLKQAKLLVEAAKLSRTKYQNPKVRLVLPRITRDDPPHVAKVLESIKALGVTVQTVEDIPATPELSSVIGRMVVDPFANFSDVLNVDCTMVFAFISDLSHGRVEQEDWYHKFIVKQMEVEKEDLLLPNHVWPACASRKLVCTRLAVERAQEIVDTIGTDTEKKRMRLLFDLDGPSTNEELTEGFQRLSEYRIPPEWKLPFEIVDVDLSTIKSKLPPIANEITNVLSDLNQSVFFYGWQTGYTTISSHRVVAKDIENTIEAKRGSEDVRGPGIWLSPMARSLVGREKQRRGAKD
ncbi:Aspartate aminotransferase protein [Rutstroemia sp. NJR-2017a BBW]|nr:Aspartate aminotransferase protein [Rutstroemia sp. NJR-2017a BBW]